MIVLNLGLKSGGSGQEIELIEIIPDGVLTTIDLGIRGSGWAGAEDPDS